MCRKSPSQSAARLTSASLPGDTKNSCRGPALVAVASPFVGRSTPFMTAKIRHFDGRLAMILPEDLLRLSRVPQPHCRG